MKRDDSPPAFPRPCSEDRKNGDQPDGNSTIAESDGMTLRQWYAGQALAGILAAHAEEGVNLPSDKEAASMSFQYADAMIEESRKR